MRGDDEQQLGVFSYVSPEQRVPQDHPLRPIRTTADEALCGLKPRLGKLYAKTGRPSIAPEKLLRALLLQVLYSATQQPNSLWLCPKCGGPMVVIERLTAAQIQLRSPPVLVRAT
jgi:hypothetical protein